MEILIWDPRFLGDICAKFWDMWAMSVRSSVPSNHDWIRRQQKSTWFAEECRQAAIGKNDAYHSTLKSAATGAVYEKYSEKRREERHLFRRTRHEFVKADCGEIETHGSRNDARKFFQKIKRMSEGFKTGAFFCKDQDGNLMTDMKSSLDLWRTHFNTILNGDDTNNSANEI